MVGQIVATLRRLGGLASLEEIEGQISRSGAVTLPPATLDLVVRMAVGANRDGRGMGCFTQPDQRSVSLVAGRSAKPFGTDMGLELI